MKKSFLLLAFLSISLFTFYSSHIYSQQPTQEWVARWPDPLAAPSSGKAIKLDSLGNIYVLADSTWGYGFLKYNQNGNLLLTAHYWPGNPYNGGSGSYFDINSNGDVYITGPIYIGTNTWIQTVKFNSNGIFQWGKIYNNDIDDSPQDMKIDKAGNIIVVGGTYNGGNIGYALAIKYNSNGDTLWVSNFNNGQTQASNSPMVIDNSNNIYTAGYITYVGKCLITKYASNGNIVWFQTFTLEQGRTNLGKGINLDNYGNIYVIGTQIGLTVDDCYILKLNNAGDTLWSSVYPNYATGGNTLWGPVISNNGGEIYYTATISDTIGTQGVNIATFKYSSSGTLQWRRYYNGGVLNTECFPTGIKLDKFNNVYVCGGGYYQATSYDLITLKYLPTGTLQWITRYTGNVSNLEDFANNLFIDSNLMVYVSGASQKLNLNDDAVTIKYSQPIGIISNGNQMPHIYQLNQNYPNPFNSSTIINYELPKRSSVQLKIFNSIGQLVKTLVNTEQDASYYSILLNADGFASGVYFYQLIVTSEQSTVFSETKKLVLIK